MLDAANGVDAISESVQKRLKRSRACAPAAVIVDGFRYRRCEMYICPMCWYRHVRDRLSSLTPVLENQTLGKLVRLVGRAKSESTIPSRAKLAGLYALAGKVREKLKVTGALTSVRLMGSPGLWVPSVDMLVSGTNIQVPEEVNVELQGSELNWAAFHVQRGSRGSKLKNYIAELLRYPVGLFASKLPITEIANLFDGTRLVRSSVSGIMASRLRDG